MAPNSPAPLRAPLTAQPTLAPSTTLASGTTSRLPLPPPTTAPISRSTGTHTFTPAEAYAHAHSKKGQVGLGVGGSVPGQGTTKPIFGWITRKLGGAGRRATLSEVTPPTHIRTQSSTRYTTSKQRGNPLSPIQIFQPARQNSYISRSESHSLRSYSMSYATSTQREANNPYPNIPVPPRHHRTSFTDSYVAPSVSMITRSRTPSLRSEGEAEGEGEGSLRVGRSLGDEMSLVGGGADENASVRAIPPSHPGSPTPSNSHSHSTSLLSPRYRPPSPVRTEARHSFPSSTGSSARNSRRDSGSTKPTTIVSFDSGPHVAHIAQAPSIPTIPAAPIPVVTTTPRTPATTPGPSITPPTPVSPTHRQAPKHTLFHPRDNPHPSSPPGPNASTLTLASSTFALSPPPAPPSIRLNSPIPIHRPGSLATSPSVTFARDPDNRPSSIFEYPPSQHALSIHGIRGRADRDASVRAVRRKGSWESYESGWSWRGAGAGAGSGSVSGSVSRVEGQGQGLVPHRMSGVGIPAGEDEGSIYVTSRSREGEVGGTPRSDGRFDLEASVPIIA